MLQVVVEAEHPVKIALIALPVVINEAHRALVVLLAVSVHVVVAEIGEKVAHLLRGQRKAVRKVSLGKPLHRAGLDGVRGPVLVQEENVRVLQKSHLLHARKRIDLPILHVDELRLDIRPFLKDFGEVGHVFQIIADRHKNVALRVFDDLAGAHARVVDGIRAVVRVAEDQVLLLAVNGLGNIFPVYGHVGARIKILHDLHVVVIQG